MAWTWRSQWRQSVGRGNKEPDSKKRAEKPETQKISQATLSHSAILIPFLLRGLLLHVRIQTEIYFFIRKMATLQDGDPDPERAERNRHAQISFDTATHFSQCSYSDLLQNIKRDKLHVVILGGYSGQGYNETSTKIIKKYIKNLVSERGNNTLYVSGATHQGIGAIYEWVPEFAAALNLTNVHTAGMVSMNAWQYGVCRQDYVVFVDTPISSWELKSSQNDTSLWVDLAVETDGELIFFKGGAVARAELTEAVKRRRKVTVVTGLGIQRHPETDRSVRDFIEDGTREVVGVEDADHDGVLEVTLSPIPGRRPIEVELA